MTMDQRPPARGGFFSTLPGVLTAVAAVVTAVGGVYGVYSTQQKDDASPTPTVTVTSTPTADPTTDPPPDPPPDPAPDETDVEVVDGLWGLHGGGAAADSDAVVDPFVVWLAAADLDRQSTAAACGTGELAACVVLEQLLAQDCQDTWDAACDVLYLVEPEGSELEDLGATCGYLFGDWTYAGRCTT